MLLALLLCFAQDVPLEATNDPVAEAAVRASLRAERTTCYVGETLPVTLVLELDEAFFAERAAQLFRRELDWPVQVQAPWLRGSDDVELTRAGPGDAGAGLLALEDDPVAADRLVRRSGTARLELDLEARPLRPGTLELEGALVRVAYSTGRATGLFGDAAPTDRVDAVVRGSGLELDARPLPAEGRPIEFTGAIGEFDVRAELGEPAADGTVSLDLVVAGDGNLGAFPAARLPRIPGAAVQDAGAPRERDGRAIVFRYELRVEGAGRLEVPALPFAYFDPGSGEYVTKETVPRAVTVPARADARRPSPDPSGRETAPGDDEPGPSSVLPFAAAFVVIVLAASARRRRRRRR